MPVTNLGALRAVTTLVDKHLDQIFPEPAPPQAHAPLGLDEQVETGAYPPAIARLMASVQTIPLREGLIIQSAVHHAHTGAPDLVARQNWRCAIGQGDRALVAANRYTDLGAIAPPAASEQVGRREIDVMVFDERVNTLRLIDIKRAPCPADEAQIAMAEAALAIRRQLASQGVTALRTEVVILRWLADPAEARAHGYVTRETVDAALGLPVQELVDAGVRRFREGLEQRFAQLQRAGLCGNAHVEPEQPAPIRQPVAERANREAVMRAFNMPRGRARPI